MKKLITMLTLLAFLVSVPVAFGRGGHTRFNLDKKWKRIEAQQKRQSEKFEAIEREARSGDALPESRTHPSPYGNIRAWEPMP
ncbi:hypothetical protein [Desulfomonile tiedjei]|uniref:Uncharacterized protein n=1 Tax=Desulfomonile tiedjei (strain ATCC 49306 / DSM 6799 / DCB-1) TaxID=706587 RepID=I4C5W2_DESTA|nr:hypothetical protein [Desulfomonile tiedjei]AFM24953.1 hypothetical protein Desti_2263 [Desulfomonile tiedjei DSM 6799]